jgi:peptide chain release factor 1
MDFEALMIEQFDALQARYETLNHELMDPVVQGNPALFREKAKRQAEVAEVLEVFREYKSLLEGQAQAQALLASERDPEMLAMAREEAETLAARRPALERSLRLLLLPRDPNEGRDVIVELRAGTGGDEASLFAAEMLRMYTRFAERRGWKVELMDANLSEVCGYKEAILAVRGAGVYSALKHERGVHRVQRVPDTEANGRIHTSTVTVVVMPEPEEREIRVDEKELKWEIFCSSGAGGQSVNTTYSAVRVTHLPTGLQVSMQDERSQQKNRAKALRVLAARLQALEEERRIEALSVDRKGQVGGGERSEKIRTYNFPQNRVTDHRIGFSLHNLTSVMEGGLDPLLDKLVEEEQAAQLAALAPK